MLRSLFTHARTSISAPQVASALLITLAMLIVAFFLAAPLVQAQQPTPTDDEVNRIARNLYCPVCENTPLDVCPTEACRQWRDLIRQQLSDGWSEDRIQQYFVEQYGARVLSEPPRTGLNWLIYILPPLIILAGAFMLFRSLRSWTVAEKPEASEGTRKKPAVAKAKTPADDYVARLEDELKKRS
jgi:cytochrome c-type biogenesis protein CcmH